jgi:SAM-dependent methyltransferase
VVPGGGAILRVLKSEEENRRARAELERRGHSLLRGGWVGRVGRRLGIERLCIGDLRKSWDVLATADFLDERLARNRPVADFGAYRSEITGVLCRMGYAHLHAVDLNPRVRRGPYRDLIHYVAGDYFASGLATGSLGAVTSISAIEHGHAVDRLLAEVDRVLEPGGYFVGSTDYWPQKVATSGVRLFGMDWTIFSAEEMAAFFDAARGHGLAPAGALDYQAGEPVIDFAGRRYTFAWFALRKAGGAA